MSRRKSRIIAFQALYSYDASATSLDNLLEFSWIDRKELTTEEDKSKSEEELTYAKFLICGTIENLSTIDNLIKSHLSENWDFSRLNKVTLAILRLSIYSLLFQSEVPKSIVIDEAISISKEFGVDDSFKFVNAVLDKISKEQN